MKKSILTFALLMAGAISSFCQTLTYATAYKKDTEVNPILPYNLCADPTAVEYNGRLYVYGTNDQQEYNSTKNKGENTYGKINQLVCFSTADLVNWTFHGVIEVKSLSSWMNCSWAPSIVSRVEKDGKTHFYLYYTNQASGIGVLTSTSPTGPWKDPIGKALINWATPGRGEQSNIIDPGVCIDDEGNGWLSFGGGDPNKNGSKLMPGNARIVKLGSNMTSLSGEIKEIPAPYHFEANELNYINGKFVFSYSGGWSPNSGEWSGYKGKGSYSCPSTCAILSMQSDEPLNPDSWKYTGEILKNPGNYGYPWGNNHSHLQKFGETWYMTYHTQGLAKAMGFSGGYRGIAISKCTVNESTVRITAPAMNNAGPSMLTANRLTTDNYIEAETMANCGGITVGKVTGCNGMAVSEIQAGDWTMIRGLKFTNEMKSVTVRLKGKCKMEIRTSLKTASTAIATVESTSTSFKNITVDLKDAIPADKTYNNLYFVFTEASGSCYFDRYAFNALTVDEQTALQPTSEEVVATNDYDLSGVKQDGSSKKGIYIEQRVMRDGSRKTVKRVK